MRVAKFHLALKTHTKYYLFIAFASFTIVVVVIVVVVLKITYSGICFDVIC